MSSAEFVYSMVSVYLLYNIWSASKCQKYHTQLGLKGKQTYVMFSSH